MKISGVNSRGAYIILLIVLQISCSLSAQDPDNRIPVRFVTLASQNDFYQYHFHSDRNFTNGFQIHTSFPDYEKIFTRRSIIGNLTKGSTNFILSIGQKIYTPANIMATEVDSSDRPYAGLLFLNMSRTISNKEALFQVQSKLYFGIIGPASGAMETQNFIHRLINNDPAAGWHNQIGNGLMFDYEINIRKGLKHLPEIIDLSGSADLHLGTIYNYALLGGRFRFGLFNSPYLDLGIYNPSINREKASRNKKYQIYINLEAQGGYLLFDGTASGSLLSFKPSPYIVPPEDVNQWIYSLSYGITLSWKTFQFNYLNLFTNPLYSQEKYAGWGEVELIFSF